MDIFTSDQTHLDIYASQTRWSNFM